MTRSHSFLRASIVGLFVVLIGCDSAVSVEPELLTTDDLSEKAYNLVALDETDAVILLGSLTFGPNNGDFVSGQWDLQTWGEQERIGPLPEGGTLDGIFHGSTAIVQIRDSSDTTALGLLFEGVEGELLVGQLVTSREPGFRGRFELRRQSE